MSKNLILYYSRSGMNYVNVKVGTDRGSMGEEEC